MAFELSLNIPQFGDEYDGLKMRQLVEEIERLHAILTTDTLNAPIHSGSYFQFDVEYADGSNEGRLQWNAEDGTLEFGMPGGSVNMQIGQERVVRCRNESGAQIANGSLV